MKNRNEADKQRSPEPLHDHERQQDVEKVMDLVRQFPARGGPLPMPESSSWRRAVNMPRHLQDS